MDVPPNALEVLTARLQSLEQRVAALEHTSAPLIAPEPVASPAAVVSEELSLAQSGSVLSVLAYALLGIAGAYVLRFIAESSSLPKLAIAAVAIVYALLWLVGAARVQAWFSSAVYAGTSALILAPMLWELTLRFKVLPTQTSAAILCVFVIAATALAWKRNRAPVYWIANATAAAAALALSIATHQFLPFIATLLLMALTCEYAAARNHTWSVRPLVAAAADMAVWALIFIYSSPQSTRTDYPALGAAGLLLPGCLLLLIYAVSVVLRTTLQGHQITVFETGQTIIAFLLASSSVLYFVPGWGAIVLGAVCLLFSIACYVAAFLLCSKAAASRNFHVYSAWAACLLLAGCLLCLPPFWLAACLALAALAAFLAESRLTLKLHGLVFLLAAAIASGLIEYAFHALIRNTPVSLTASVCLAAACAMICSAAGKRGSTESWMQQLINLATAVLAVFALAALLVEVLLRLVALRWPPEAHHVAFIRTLVLCALALALAKAGSRWRRVELTRIAYATLGLVAAKLLLEDLPLGHLEVIAASIFLFAITLIAVPRLARIEQKT
jgi:uncharacterized membrane protein YuzA (DUF378 family)